MAFHKALKDAGLNPTSSKDLFKDFHNLQGVWTHPLMLDMKKNNQKVKTDNDSDNDDNESESENESTDDENISLDDVNSENNLMPGTSTSEWNVLL